jgi:tetratricopeptide (TPR) repeat protein
MKKQLLVAGFIFLSTLSFGQKKEIKKAQKAIKSGNYTEAVDFLKQGEALLGEANKETKVLFYLTKAEAYVAGGNERDIEKLKIAADAVLKAEALKPSGADQLLLFNESQAVRAALVNSAIDDQNAQNYLKASEKLYLSYNVSKQDTSDLYFAAGNAVNAKDFDLALKHYQELLDVGYTGIDISNPQSKSRKGEILRNMILIYLAKGNDDKARELIGKARTESPDDVSLINAEAELAYKTGDMVKYNSLMEEVIAKDPTNPQVYFNLGVASKKMGDSKKATEYYTKALELKPDYYEANLNMAFLILEPEASIIEQMNNLGTSSADFKKYDELDAQKNELYKKAIPFLEEALKGRPDNVDLLRTLMNIYSQTGDDDKYKALKARVDELTGN